MRKILLIALTVFLTVVASAQNFDNGCMYSPTHSTTIEAVQLDAYQSDVLSIVMNVQYEMPVVSFYSLTADVVYLDLQTLAMTYADTGQTISYAKPQKSFTNYLQRNTAAHRHRPSGIMIRQVQAA